MRRFLRALDAASPDAVLARFLAVGSVAATIAGWTPGESTVLALAGIAFAVVSRR